MISWLDIAIKTYYCPDFQRLKYHYCLDFLILKYYYWIDFLEVGFMKREISEELQKWKNKKNRKVLLLRGARQVGKTYIIRKFGNSFSNFLEVNFEEHPSVCNFFNDSLSPDKIIEKLSLYFNIAIVEGKTLLFFDEIQACPNALRSLRFFYEKAPLLHLISAGSLLEFALSEIPSFGVGRIESLFMYPMNFYEFMEAKGLNQTVKLINNSSFNNPVEQVFHDKILNNLKIFQIIGGLPDVVKTYIETGNLILCQKIIDDLLLTYIDDFAKYKTKVSTSKLKEVFYSIAFQAGGKFKYSNVSKEPSSGYKQALDLLIKSGLAYKVFHTAARGIPLGAQIKNNKFKVVPFDTGIYQRLQGLDLSEFILSDNQSLINKGSISEIFVHNELISTKSHNLKPEIYYWHREKRGSNAEVDYVISVNENIIPIEVKAGTKGQMQSLHLFLKERNLDYGIRISAELFSVFDKIKVLPIYASRKVWKLNKNTL